MKIQILGTGCAKCKKLEENVRQAALELGIEHTIEKVTDINDIMSFGVMMTPALVLDGDVKLIGRVSDVKHLKNILSE